MTATLPLLGFWFFFFHHLTYHLYYISNSGLMLWHLKIIIKLAFIVSFFLVEIFLKKVQLGNWEILRTGKPSLVFLAITLSFLSLPEWPLSIYCWSIIAAYHRIIANRAGRELERLFNPSSCPKAGPAVPQSSLTDVCLSCF